MTFNKDLSSIAKYFKKSVLSCGKIFYKIEIPLILQKVMLWSYSSSNVLVFIIHPLLLSIRFTAFQVKVNTAKKLQMHDIYCMLFTFFYVNHIKTSIVSSLTTTLLSRNNSFEFKFFISTKLTSLWSSAQGTDF